MFENFTTQKYRDGKPVEEQVTNLPDHEKKVYELDGYHHGMTAWIFSESCYIKPEGKLKYFTNYEMLESALLSAGYSRLNYQIEFVLADSKHIDIEDTYFNKETGMWEFDLTNSKPIGICGFIKPSHISTVTSIGYLRNCNSDVRFKVEGHCDNFKEKASAFSASKFDAIFREVKHYFELMSTFPKYGLYIKECTDSKMVICLRGTTGKIVIQSNKDIISYNESERKANGLRCLPFNKEMDKYGTLYVYTTIDNCEKEYIKDRIYYTLCKLLEFAEDYNSDSNLQYERLAFAGYIKLKEE